MKKLFALAFMSLAAVSWTPTTASAWWPFYPACCKSCCTTTICLRQYNAFTPVCSGTLNCDGCCPVNLSSGSLTSGPAIFQHPYAAGQFYNPYGSAIFAGQGYPMGQLPPAAILSQPPMQGPVMGGMPAAPMAPMPAPAGAAPVQGIGYRSMYGAVPYYWNNGR